MIPQPFAHQKQTTDFLTANPIVFCTSDAGTGKTRSVLDAIKTYPGRTLVIAPKSILAPSWGDDIKKFTPDQTYTIAYAGNRELAFETPSDIVLINHDGVKWLADNTHRLNDFTTLVADESTAFKHSTSARSRACAKIAEHFSRRINLSGTPNPNGILDIWHQMKILDGGERLGRSYWAFRAATHTPIANGQFTKWVEKEGAQEAVYGLISDVNIRYKLEDCLSIPENFVTEIDFELSPEHLALYHKLRAASVLELGNTEVNAINAAALTTKLLQAASGAVYGTNNKPLVLATERYELVLDLAEQREQCLIAFNWTHQRDQLIKQADKRKLSYGLIDGSVPAEKRTRAVEQFQAGKLKLIFAHPASASHGLTLTRGTTTIWASPIYDAEKYEQFCHRIYRAGQTRRTETLHIAAKNTLEAKVYERLRAKRANMHNLLDLLT